MATRKDGAVLRQLNTLFGLGAIRELTDGQLLERFATGHGEAAELAFAALVERHGAMVERVCRAQLADLHDRQDAFQATFLVLVKKARALWVRDSLGPWLHQVAFRTASCARSAAAQRRRHERRAAELAANLDEHETAIDATWEQILHEEIDRLPDRYRIPIVLCDLEGLTCEEAARQMGRPVGTVKSWRSRGRQRLRLRLIRSGLAPATALGTSLATGVARAAVRERAAEELVRTAVRALSDGSTAGVFPASVRALVNGVLKAMFFSKLRMMASIVFALTVVAAGLGAAARVAAEDPKDAVPQARDTAKPAPGRQRRTAQQLWAGVMKEVDTPWSLSLREAVRIGLDNAETIRLISLNANAEAGDAFEIAPRTSDVDAHRFKAEVMAHVRSIEQQYWSLAQQHVQLWSVKRAVEVAEETVKRELSDLNIGHGTAADVAESQQRLEQFKLDVVTKTSDVITTERQLRNILGLPPADGRRIVPVTAPVEARSSPDWETCLAEMLEKHPDILQAKARLKEAEAKAHAANLDEVAKSFLPALDTQDRRAPSAQTLRDRSAQLEQQKASYQQVIHQTTHSLARFFLEVDANYKQFKTASRLRAAAAQRLKAQRAFYEEGRITIDRYFDSVSQCASAIAQEAQFKTTYNIALMALEEAKGTLLDHDRIVIAERGPAAMPAAGKLDSATKTASHSSPPPSQGPVAALLESSPSAIDLPAKAAVAREPTAHAADAGKTYSFQMTVGLGPKPFEIRGSFTISPVRSVEASKDQ